MPRIPADISWRSPVPLVLTGLAFQLGLSTLAPAAKGASNLGALVSDLTQRISVLNADQTCAQEDFARNVIPVVAGGIPVPRASEIARQTVLIAIRLAPDKVGTCMGAILSNRIIVTTAHCVSSGPDLTGPPRPLSDIRVIFGNASIGNRDPFGFPSFPMETNAVKAKVAEIVRYPGYRAMSTTQGWHSEGDIAILRLKSEIPRSARSVTIAPPQFTPQPGSRVTITGSGVTQHSPGPAGYPVSRTMRAVDLEVSPSASPLTYPGKTHLVGKNGAGACWGDAGAPVFVQEEGNAATPPEWIGVVGETNCLGDTNYTDVRPYLDWMLRASKE